MTDQRTRPSLHRRSRRTHDLDLPTVGAPRAFALAFAAVRRCRGFSAIGGESQPEPDGTDDLGLPVEGDAGDFACAFLAVRSHGRPARP
jgi:hypothetical protein